MEKKYKWKDYTLLHNARYNSVYCVEDNSAWLPAMICDGVRFMAAFHIKQLVIDNEEIIVEEK